MFESDLFEHFSRAHPLMPAMLYLPVVVLSLYFGLYVQQLPASTIALQVVAGYAGWTLAEYWLHRLLFHLPIIGPKTARVSFVLHGVHHDYPWDETRLVMPAGASLALCALTYLGFRALLGEQFYGPFAGFVLGYVIYDEVHWYVHAHQPTSRFGRWLRREHFIHHFKDHTSRFGVSCPWLDYVFGTRGRRLKDAS